MPDLYRDPLAVDWRPAARDSSYLDPVTPSVPSGLLLGTDAERGPVVIRLFRDQPTDVVLIGGGWAARLVVMRAFGIGARVLVRSSYQGWEGFGQTAAGQDERLRVGRGEPVVPKGAATPHQPMLLVDDLGEGSVESRGPLGPWQTRLTVLRRLTAFGFPLLAEANVVILQRLTTEETSAATAVLGLAGETARLVQMMYDDMLALIGGGVNRYLWTAPTESEVAILGRPSRG
jgi:hypothetical protein